MKQCLKSLGWPCLSFSSRFHIKCIYCPMPQYCAMGHYQHCIRRSPMRYKGNSDTDFLFIIQLTNAFSESWKHLILNIFQAGQLLNSVSGIADICLRIIFMYSYFEAHNSVLTLTNTINCCIVVYTLDTCNWVRILACMAMLVVAIGWSKEKETASYKTFKEISHSMN